MNFSAINWNFMLSDIFPIIIPLKTELAGAIPNEELYIFFVAVDIVSLHIDTAEKHWEKS